MSVYELLCKLPESELVEIIYQDDLVPERVCCKPVGEIQISEIYERDVYMVYSIQASTAPADRRAAIRIITVPAENKK